MAEVTMTFNGTASTAYNIKITNIKRPVKANKGDTFVELPGRDGSYLVPRKFRDQNISVEIVLTGDTSLVNLRSTVRLLAAWLNTSDWANLVFSDEPSLHWHAKVMNIEMLEQIILYGKTTIEFRVQPFAYGAEVTETFTADALTLNNSGTYQAFPRFSVTFTGSASEWKVTNSAGLYIRVVDSFVYGDVLTIDTATGAILKNGVRTMNKLDWQYSKLFALTVGSNTLTITPTGKCSAQVKYDPTYL